MKKNTYTNELMYFGMNYNLIVYFLTPKGNWADPGGTARPGQPVVRAEQAPDISPLSKNQFNIEVLE